MRVARLPLCDTHGTIFVGEPVPLARVDGRTVYGPWANMCLECHDRIGVGLGTGKGQRLVLR